MDMRDDTATGNCRLDQLVQLLVTSNGLPQPVITPQHTTPTIQQQSSKHTHQLKMARSYTFHLEILGRVARQFKHLGRQVLEDRGTIHSRRGTHAAVCVGTVLQKAVDASDRELNTVTAEETTTRINYQQQPHVMLNPACESTT